MSEKQVRQENQSAKIEEQRLKRIEGREARRKLRQHFNETRDPILNDILYSMERTRKWITFMGVLIVVGLAIGLILALISLGLY